MQKKVSLRKLENLFFILAFALGAAIFYGSSQVSSFLSSTALSARTYGMIVSGALALAAGAKLLHSVLGAARRSTSGRAVSFSQIRRLLICAGAMVLYCYGITNVGYFTSTTLFMFAMLAALAPKRGWKAVCAYLAGSAAFNVLLFYLFRAMKVFMPNTPLL